jgi:hypothetical protein
MDFIGNTVVGNSGLVTQTVGGVAIYGTPEFHYNNIYGNSPYDVVVVSSSDISGTLNYWGTTASADILAHVYDWYDESSRGRLLFIPYLQEPGLDAPVPPPLNLAATFGEDSVTLTWDAIPGTTASYSYDIIPDATTNYGYRIYYGASEDPPYDGSGLPQGDSPIDVGNLTTFTLTGLTPGESYYFAITAYDDQGRESWYSSVVARPGGPSPGFYLYLPLIIKN